MNVELENSIKGYEALFKETNHPIFGAIWLYTKRTGNIIKLDGIKLRSSVEVTKKVENNEIEYGV